MELRLQEFLEGFLVHFLRSRNFFTCGFIYDEFRLRFLVLYKEYTISLWEATRVAVQNITTVLAVILVESPSNGLVNDFYWEEFIWMLLLKLLKLLLDINILVLVI